MGLVQEGAPILSILERKTDPLWRYRDLKAVLHDDFGAFGSGEHEFTKEEQHGAFRAIIRTWSSRTTPATGDDN